MWELARCELLLTFAHFSHFPQNTVIASEAKGVERASSKEALRTSPCSRKFFDSEWLNIIVALIHAATFSIFCVVNSMILALKLKRVLECPTKGFISYL